MVMGYKLYYSSVHHQCPYTLRIALTRAGFTVYFRHLASVFNSNAGEGEGRGRGGGGEGGNEARVKGYLRRSRSQTTHSLT